MDRHDDGAILARKVADDAGKDERAVRVEASGRLVHEQDACSEW